MSYLSLFFWKVIGNPSLGSIYDTLFDVFINMNLEWILKDLFPYILLNFCVIFCMIWGTFEHYITKSSWSCWGLLMIKWAWIMIDLNWLSCIHHVNIRLHLMIMIIFFFVSGMYHEFVFSNSTLMLASKIFHAKCSIFSYHN